MKNTMGTFVMLMFVAASPGLAASAEDEDTVKPPEGCDRSSEDVQKDKEKKPSYFTQLWDLDENKRSGGFAIRQHRSNYILPFTYNYSPNKDAVRAADADRDLLKSEFTFQLSLKTQLVPDVFCQKMDLWFAYTQRSFWQLYDFNNSSPFRETNYEPELLLNLRTDYSILGLQGRFVTVGINHQSNGQSEPLSRSWNRVVANVGLEAGDFSFLLKGWYRIPEDDEDDDNPRMEKYLGYGELWCYYHFCEDYRLDLMVRNNLRARHNRGAVQVGLSVPLLPHVGLYAQYYYGYGESLLDYNHETNRAGVGFILQ